MRADRYAILGNAAFGRLVKRKPEDMQVNNIKLRVVGNKVSNKFTLR
jgi:hypothetical protein